MNVKPGDLAVIVNSVIPANLGLFVTVIKAYDERTAGIQVVDQGPLWHCQAKGVITYENIYGQRVTTTDGPIPDECLRPIRPEPEGYETETKKNLEVTA